MIPSKITRAGHAPNGFALVVTLSLMILLTVIAVGLLSLSSISLRSSSQGQAAAEARANARLALMLAIGQIQREMGPDSRISAPPDAGAIATGGQPRWTTVHDAWKTDPASSNAPLTPVSRIPNFRTWLVSGANGTVVSSSKLISLVGPGSLGANYVPGDLVSAPLVEVSDLRKKGSIAWWTADESAKAKITAGAATDNFAAASNPFSDAQSPPRTGSQALPQLSAFEWKPKQRSAAITTASVNLAADLKGPGIGNLNHDVTVYSAGVLSDVREGRLKRDLSNLLTRPISEVEDKPLYLADGRMNRFVIGADGSFANGPGIPSDPKPVRRTSSEWGINLEELFLFHNLHREIQWTGQQPRIVSKKSREEAVNDRFYLYRKPTIEAAQFILSLKAVPDTAAGRYKMVIMLDGMVAVSNPNDMTFEYAPGLQLGFQLFTVPYRLRWDIRRGNSVLYNSVQPVATSLQQFKGYVGGGPAATDAAGFSLQPGEAGVFGSSTSSTFTLSLQRGFVPSGGVQLDESLKATNLLPTDMIDFKMERLNSTTNNPYYTTEFGSNIWNYCNYWLGPRGFNGKNNGWHLGAINVLGAPSTNDTYVNQLLPQTITTTGARVLGPTTSDAGFTKPQPFMILSFLKNVEQSGSSATPEAFASRPFLMSESANSMVGTTLSNLADSSQMSQFVMKVEPANYQFRTLAGGAGGRNMYQGGSRQPGLGSDFYVLKRRIPYAPPLSLGAFENAIASGFARRFKDQTAIGDGTDKFPASARTLSGESPATPFVAKAIGNAFASPFLAPSEVYRSYSSPSGGSDHSWMANNALWDSWFLSGIVDGRGLGGNSFQPDSRSPRAQFTDLAKGSGLLRNQRFIFHPYRSADTALSELFDGDVLKPSAINDLGKYLLIDGAFNVNSTSTVAWKALLSSVRKQELIANGGAKKQFGNPYGTLGYALNDSSTNDWTGLRDLSETDIDSLAKAIVLEVKARGPFLNLGDFVNRRPNSSDASQQAVGALQAAIDKSGLNGRFTGGGRSVAAADFGSLPGAGAISAEPAPARSAGSAGHLTQARLLTALGSQITVRSDTFVIRTYGDARDSSGKIILARAWCEAVVQRLPEYVDPTDRPEAAEGWPGSSDKLTPINTLFGRRLNIRSFRWLNSNEI
jgi:hypothetical protein